MARSEVVVDLAALRHNVALLAGLAPGAETMAVVKADGYGHGAVDVARAALEAGATWLGSCSLAGSARPARRRASRRPILAWLDAPDEDLAAGIAADVDLSVASHRATCAGSSSAAEEADARPRIHLKIDTGLSRNGCQPARLARAGRGRAQSIEVVAVWSHLACADEIGAPVDRPAGQAVRRRLRRGEVARACTPKRHLANSAALLTRPDLHFDIVRPGIAMYGLNPVPTDHDLRPVMSFRSYVALTKRIPAGESVSYGMTWTAQKDTTLALVPAGYADGVPRSALRPDGGAPGREAPPGASAVSAWTRSSWTAGTTRSREGAEVVLFGDGRRGEPTATEWAELTGTIDYEIVCGMYRPRVRRIYT